jgi:hypothetical protein
LRPHQRMNRITRPFEHFTMGRAKPDRRRIRGSGKAPAGQFKLSAAHNRSRIDRDLGSSAHRVCSLMTRAGVEVPTHVSLGRDPGGSLAAVLKILDDSTRTLLACHATGAETADGAITAIRQAFGAYGPQRSCCPTTAPRSPAG